MKRKNENRENRSVPTSPELAEYYTNSLLDHGSAAASHSDTSQYTSLVAKDTSPLRGNTRRTTSSSSTFPLSPPELSRSANRSDEDTTQRAPTSASAPAPRAVPRFAAQMRQPASLLVSPEVMFGRLRVVGEADDEGSFAYSQSSANEESEWSNYDDTDQDYSDSDGAGATPRIEKSLISEINASMYRSKRRSDSRTPSPSSSFLHHYRGGSSSSRDHSPGPMTHKLHSPPISPRTASSSTHRRKRVAGHVTNHTDKINRHSKKKVRDPNHSWPQEKAEIEA